MSLADIQNTSGVIRRIWLTISDRSPLMLRGLRLEMTWDGAERSAVSVPLGDFFCQGLGKPVAFENALFSNPEGKSFNCVVPMPFRSSARITLTNETGQDLRLLFFDVNYTIGDHHPLEMLYFHAHWHRENPTQMDKDYVVLPLIKGRGRFLGVNFGVIADTKKYAKAWWGEGEVKMFLDGDSANPTLCGTGAEDYIGTAWGQGAFAHAYQGSPYVDEERLQYSFYRLHLPDPIWFESDLRVTIQQIGCCGMNTAQEWHDAGFDIRLGKTPIDLTADVKAVCFEREDDWSSCAWFFLESPTNGLPELASLAERTANLEESASSTEPPPDISP